MKDIENYLTKEEVRDILQEIKNSEAVTKGMKRKREKEYMLILSLWRTGTRISELLNVKLKHIKFNEKVMLIKDSKTKAGVRRIVLREDYLRRLSNYIDKRDISNSDPLFDMSRQTAYNIVKKWSKRAGYKGVSCHTFRHSYATHMIKGVENIFDLMLLQRQLGHKEMDHTATYLHFKDERVKELKDSLDW